jgi:drug/metabolite transporter (DMT)-like permease
MRKSPYVLLVIATCLWGGNFVAGKLLVADVPPLMLAAARWLTALALLLPFYGRAVWHARSELLRRWPQVAVLSLFGVAGFNSLVYVAVQTTSPINAALMNAATPVFILLISLLFLGEKLSVARTVGILVSIAGVVWIIGKGSLDAILALQFTRGDLWMVLAILFWALYSILMKRWAGSFEPNSLFVATIIIAVMLLVPISALELGFGSHALHVNWTVIGGVLYIGVFASIVAFTCWNRAVELLGPARSAGFLNLIPVFSALFASLFTGERLRLFHVVGTALILGGIALSSRASKRTKEPRRA